jgi:hypothetical protein
MTSHHSIIVISLLLLNACTFDLVSVRKPVFANSIAITSESQCDAINREHSIATLGAGILGGLAGAGGLSSIPVDDDRTQRGLIVGSSVSGIGAMTMGLWAQERAERFEQKCTEPRQAVGEPRK